MFDGAEQSASQAELRKLGVTIEIFIRLV